MHGMMGNEDLHFATSLDFLHSLCKAHFDQDKCRANVMIRDVRATLRTERLRKDIRFEIDLYQEKNTAKVRKKEAM